MFYLEVRLKMVLMMFYRSINKSLLTKVTVLEMNFLKYLWGENALFDYDSNNSTIILILLYLVGELKCSAYIAYFAFPTSKTH